MAEKVLLIEHDDKWINDWEEVTSKLRCSKMSCVKRKTSDKLYPGTREYRIGHAVKIDWVQHGTRNLQAL